VSDNEVTGSSSGAFMHGPTYMGNPVACAAASATLKLFRDFDWQGSVARIEKELTEQLSPMAALPNVRDVRVLGAVGVLELEQMPSADVVNTVIKETGVWLRPFSRFVYTMPPYITTSEEIRRITDAMGKIAGA
jgi:adenosylmethionine-8-amino-7-oxononanoate aminotransferase